MHEPIIPHLVRGCLEITSPSMTGKIRIFKMSEGPYYRMEVVNYKTDLHDNVVEFSEEDMGNLIAIFQNVHSPN